MSAHALEGDGLARHAARLQRLVEGSARIFAAAATDDVARVVAVEALAVLQAREARVEVHARGGCGAVACAEVDATSRGRLDDVAVEPLRDREGRPIGSLTLVGAALRDSDAALVAQVGRAAAAALEASWMFRAAVEASRARDEALAAAAHDLRGPLGTASMGAAMLRKRLEARGPELADELDLAHRIERSCKRMSGLIDGMLVGAREAGRGPVAVTPPQAP